MTISDPLPGWADHLATLAAAEPAPAAPPATSPPDPAARQHLQRLLFAALATGYHTAFSDPDAPDFVPAVSSLLSTIGANPDFTYGYTRIDGAGSYRLSGRRGGSVFVLVDLAAGGLGVMDELGPSTGMLDLDTFRIAPDGRFDILLSAERPHGHTGDWFRLDPATTTATLRRASYRWGEEDDGAIAIDRLDRPVGAARLAPAEIARRLTALAGFVERYAAFALAYSQRLRAQGVVNRLEHDDWAGRGGVAGQHYHQGLFRLAPGQALLIDTALPDPVRYWNIQVNDPLWNTIDWINHQSSLNPAQAVLDPDGRFRAVLAPTDPGVPNWLDTAGHLEGSLMLRWTGAATNPHPTLALVPLATLRDHLPPATPVTTPTQRQSALRHRRTTAQLRRRW